jgi:hypothetical protein
MSDESTIEMVKQYRAAITGKPEEEIVLDTRPFDPVKKIASILSRHTHIAYSKYYNDPKYDRIMGCSYPGHKYPHERIDYASSHRPNYDASTMILLGCIGSHIIKENDDRWCFIKILSESENSEEVVKRMCFMRIRQAYLANINTLQKDRQFDADSGKPLEQLAHDLALGVYERMMVHGYHKNYGLRITETIPHHAIVRPEFEEDYQSPVKGLVAIKPSAMIAANLLYSHLDDLDERLRNVRFLFGLILLVGAKYYQQRINDCNTSQKIQELLTGNLDLHTVFEKTVAYYHLANIEGKLHRGKYDE